ncbi:hypothetical protein KQI65_11210 [bacterium]|nr:hypothetical protein [bacterium]
MKPFRPFLAVFLTIFTLHGAAAFAQQSGDGTAQEKPLLILPAHGIQMEPLDAAPGDKATTVFLTALPLRNGFASNVNVRVETWEGNLEDYIEYSRDGFDQLGMTEIDAIPRGEDEYLIEYRGSMSGQSIRAYARIVLRGTHIYLITGLTPSQEWKQDGAAIRDCVESVTFTQSASEEQ